MTGDASLFSKIEWKDLGYVKFRDNNRLKALAIGTIGISPHSI